MFLRNTFSASLGIIYRDNIASDAYSILASILYIGGPFLLVYCILKSKKYCGVLPLGTVYNRKAAVSLSMMMFPIILITTVMINYVSFIFQQIAGLEFSSGFEDVTIKGAPQIFMSIMSMSVVPAIVEEIAIRGVLLQPLRRYGDKFAIVASALIFSMLHGNMVQIPYTLFAGIYFGYIAVATGSLWPTIVLHFLNNMFSTVITIVSSNASDAAANAVTALMLAVIVICGIVGGIVYYKMRYRVKLKKGVKTLTTGEKISSLFINFPMVLAMVIMFILTMKSVTANG